MHLKRVFLICFMLVSHLLKAQVPARAQRDFQRAMEYSAKKEQAEAIDKMKDAINTYPAYTDAYSILGQWYFDAHRFSDASALFSEASKNCKDGNKAFAKPLTKSLLYDYQPSKALQVIDSYGGNAADWQALRANAIFMQQALANPIKDSLIHLDGRVNSPDPEMYPYISADTQTLYFTRRVNNADQDFYKAKLDSCGGWFRARNLGSPPNTSAQEAAQMISADNHYLFFSRCDNRSDNGWDKGGCDLFMAYTGDSVWSVPQSFGATINTPAYEGMPCLSADNRELFYVSDRDGGYGGFDIWVSNFEDGLWQAPRNLGPAINTKGNDVAPFLHIDNNTLYFASDGHTGMGGYDLYMSRRIDDTTWSEPVNLGYPINTTANENSISLTTDGRVAYFASDRDSISGNYDLYRIGIPQELQPLQVTTIYGYTYDSLAKDRLNYASIYIKEKETGKEIYHFVSNRGDGSFMMTLPAGKQYIYDADRIGYMDMTGDISLQQEAAGHKLCYNIPLLPQGYQKPINDSLVLTIHFARNIAQLSDSDKQNITNALVPWMQEKGLIILVNGYTDVSGSPMINEQLSYMRAGLVSKVIEDLGFDPLNIQLKGWGEAEPIAPNDTEENMTLNRRVEVIIRR